MSLMIMIDYVLSVQLTFLQLILTIPHKAKMINRAEQGTGTAPTQRMWTSRLSLRFIAGGSVTNRWFVLFILHLSLVRLHVSSCE
jgi:hypothetical protein